MGLALQVPRVHLNCPGSDLPWALPPTSLVRQEVTQELLISFTLGLQGVP